MEPKMLSVKKMNGKSLSELVHNIPRKYQKKANEFFDCVYNAVYPELYDVVVKINSTNKHLVVIPHANVAIDLYSSSCRDFFEMEDFEKALSSLNDLSEIDDLIHADLDLWISLSHKIAKSFAVDMGVDDSKTFEYFSINKIVKLGRSYPMISSDFIEKLTDAAYYKKVGALDLMSSCILKSRYELLSLFKIPYNALEDNFGLDNEKDNPFILKGDKIDLCIYSSNSYVTAFTPKETYLRAIVQKNYRIYDELNEIEDGQLRYVFETFRWERDFGISLDGNAVFKKKKKYYSFDEEAHLPLYFHGIYKYCKKQSLKEGLFVWKLVNTKVNVPLSQEEFN